MVKALQQIIAYSKFWKVYIFLNVTLWMNMFRYSCYPKPPPEAVCYVTGRTFNTFDNTEFKYDICNHVIGRDLDQDEWDVALKKNCSRTCSRDLAIRHDQHEIILRADFSIKYDGYEYTIEQIKNIGAQNKGFSITHLGSILLFTSNR